jgi:methionyl aminopeptidase
VSVLKHGFHSDLNETYLVGNCSESSVFLVENTYIALMKSIEYCAPKAMYREVGNIISNHCESLGLSVVRSYTGHGVGEHLHQCPQIPHYGKNKAPGFMKTGHMFTIEPMIN